MKTVVKETEESLQQKERQTESLRANQSLLIEYKRKRCIQLDKERCAQTDKERQIIFLGENTQKKLVKRKQC